jgi:hypothetical protein
MPRHAPHSAAARGSGVLAPGVFLGFLAYFLVFVGYGFQMEDEGTQLLHLARAGAGERPYVDFFAAYTPGFHLLMSTAWRLGALPAVRIVMAVVNAASAMLLYSLGRRLADARVALIAPVLWVALLPVDPGGFVSFNIPYAAWFVVFWWLCLAHALTIWSERGGMPALVAAGLAAAGAFAFKPNAGVFALTAATWILAWHAPDRSRSARRMLFIAGLVLALGVATALRLIWRSWEAGIYLLPAGLLSILISSTYGRLAHERHASTLAALAVLWSVFGAATALWAVPLLAQLGVDGFLRSVFFVGSNADRVYWLPYPTLDARGAAVCGGLVVLGVASTALARVPHARRSALALGVAVLGGMVVAARFSMMPEGIATAIAGQLEHVSFWVVPLIQWTALALAWRSLGTTAGVSPASRRSIVLVPLALGMFWQMHPRPDFSHLAVAMPLTAALATGLLQRVLESYARAVRSDVRRTVAVLGAIALTMTAAFAVFRVAPLMAGALRCQLAGTYVALPAFELCLDAQSSDDLVAVGDTVAYLGAHAGAGEPVLAFPALAGVLVAGGFRNPVRHDYWFPGLPDHAEERSLLAQLRHAPPRFVVTLNDHGNYFRDAPEYYAELRHFVTREYALVARFGRYDVLARRSLAPGLGMTAGSFPAGALADAIDPLPAHRRQAVGRWQARLTAAEASAAALPADARGARLLLRALAEAGDLRAAGWVLAGHRRPEPLVRQEAVYAMLAMEARFRAARFRWANDVALADLRPYLAPHRARAAELSAERDPTVARFADAILAVLGGPPDEGP